ncbi:MAG: 3-deoxy-manno-octulosonate cytidylyltransferase [Gammaproteobacteria bacterium]|nr:3-deoxy-manno-octulosonate cytidylyltransferase [Gammaproteobacteria bacterium]
MNPDEFKIVIPARFASSRFPGKPLAELQGKPLLWHVYQRALESAAEEIVIATDDERIREVAENFGATVVMTDPNCQSGTDRIAEVSETAGWDKNTVIVNLQGDEPLTPPAVIQQVAAVLQGNEKAGIATLCSEIESREDFLNPNIVKVVFDNVGQALYFSRAPIPWPRDNEQENPRDAWRHIGLYAYRAGFLQRWLTMPESVLEGLEKLEQLRALQEGVIIQVEEACSVPPHGVDTPEQLQQLARLMDA